MINLPYILAHFIGDFLLQNDWQAVGKKSNSRICLIHIMLYMVPFILVELSVTQFVLIAIQHYAQDRSSFVSWWCKKVGSFQSEIGPKTLPWGHFVVDQVFHFIWLWVVFNCV